MSLEKFKNGLPISKEEILALKIYQGARPVSKTTGERYTTRMYKTINALLYPGKENEIERVFKDDEVLEVKYIEDAEELLGIMENLYSVSYKNATNMEEKEYGVRIDRASSIKRMKKGGEILSNFSVSTNGEYDLSFVKDKMALVQTSIKPKVICANINDILEEESYYANEEEILVMPFNKVTVEEKELTEIDKRIKNAKGEEAEIKVCVTIEPSPKARPLTEEEYKDKERARKIFEDRSKRENAKEFLNEIQFEKLAGSSEEKALEKIGEGAIKDYIEWKKALRTVFEYDVREKQLEIDKQLEEIENQKIKEIGDLTKGRNSEDLKKIIKLIKIPQKDNMLEELKNNIERG